MEVEICIHNQSQYLAWCKLNSCLGGSYCSGSGLMESHRNGIYNNGVLTPCCVMLMLFHCVACAFDMS